MLAPERFADWLGKHEHTDGLGYTYQYHPRSDAHSKALAEFIWQDWFDACPEIREDSEAGLIRHAINYPHTWPTTHKPKTIDLAVLKTDTSEVLISCELKAVMTEHGKSQPRVFDELQSSHDIVHRGDQTALALGVATVNIARTFVSPLRQRQRFPAPLVVTEHRQPYVTVSMVRHLRGLPQRDTTTGTGFDAFCTFLVDCDNQGAVSLWTGEPAPQPGDADHYGTFLTRVCRAYTAQIRQRLRP